MIGFLWVAVVLAVVLSFGAFAFVLVLARRLHEMEDRIERSTLEFGSALPEVGSAVPEFTATTTRGVPIDTSDLHGQDVLVLFVTSTCPPCREQATRLCEMAGEMAFADHNRPIAVVVGDPPTRQSLVAELEPIARVVEESELDGLPATFGVRAFPCALVAGDGEIRQVETDLSGIRLPAPA